MSQTTPKKELSPPQKKGLTTAEKIACVSVLVTATGILVGVLTRSPVKHGPVVTVHAPMKVKLVLLMGADPPLFPDEYDRFNCPETWNGRTARVCNAETHDELATLAVIDGAKLDLRESLASNAADRSMQRPTDPTPANSGKRAPTAELVRGNSTVGQ